MPAEASTIEQFLEQRILIMPANENEFDRLIGKQVVFDAESPYVYVGTLVSRDDSYLILENADVHDLRDAATTRDLYIVETKVHGIRSNRKRVVVRRDAIVSVSALDDVVV